MGGVRQRDRMTRCVNMTRPKNQLPGTPERLGVLSMVRMRSAGQAMTAGDRLFAGSIPEIYDQLLVPLIFEAYARDLAARIAGTRPDDLLETAAGTGVLTRAIASHLPAHGRIIATDLNQPMLDCAAATRALEGRVTWRQADALALPFDDRNFDVVACQFGVMFFPDRIKGYKEARRVLKPRGRFFFNVWDAIDKNEFADVVTAALPPIFPHDPPMFLARTAHGYHDVERIRGELAAAGFARISVETIDHTSRAATPRDAAVAYCQGTPLRNEIEARDAARLEEATRAAAEALGRRFGNGPIEGRIRAHLFAAIA
jgi:ubiquinone/menaquinone biosynthesis C-methylase UbiE